MFDRSSHYTSTRFIVALAVFILLLAPGAPATTGNDAAELAGDIAGVTGPGAISLSVRNVSSLPAEYVRILQHQLESELRSHGVRANPDASLATSDVTVTLSENLEGYLWVAAIRQGTETHVVMHAVARPKSASVPRLVNQVGLRKTLLWSDAKPILDAMVANEGIPDARLIVLAPENVLLLHQNANQWEMESSLPLAHSHTFPRDVRGRLMPAADHLFDAYLPGVECAATATMPPAMKCLDSDDPWPLLARQQAFFGAARNFFTGVIAPGMVKQTSAGAFYSAAEIDKEHYALALFAGVDGRLRETDSVNEITAKGGREWGSDIAAVNSGCGSMVLATGNGDYGAKDTIRAFDVADREPVAGSPPLEFDGPVTALWTSADGNSATATVRNLQTLAYEAYKLTIICP